MWFSPSLVGRVALLAVASLLISLPSANAIIDAPTTPAKQTKPRLDPSDNPYGVSVNYTVAWLNRVQRVFGASLIITFSNPNPDPQLVLRFQFASANTKVSTFWGPWNLTRYESNWYMAIPVSITTGQPAITPGDTAPHSYSFNGVYTGNDVDAIYPNGYSIAKSPMEDAVILTPTEARNSGLSPDIPTVAVGEFVRQQRSANGNNSNTSSSNDSSLSNAAGATNTSSSDKGSSGTPLIGLCAFAGVMAIGLTVVGVATYRRRQHRRKFSSSQGTTDRSLPMNGNKSLEDSQPQGEPFAMPEPAVINNHSPSAYTAGAITMQQVHSPEQAIAQDYYIDQDQPIEFDADQDYYEQYDDEPITGFEEQQPHDDRQDYQQDMPNYMAQSDSGDTNLEAEIIYNAAAADAANIPIEHLDLHPPVAQEYYVADTVTYDGSQAGRDSVPGYANGSIIYADDDGAYNESTAWPESATYGAEQGYAEDFSYADDEPLDGSPLPQ